MEDNRAEERIKTSIPVRQEPDGGKLIDMSRSGLSFVSQKEYEVGDPIDMHFYVGPREAPDRLELHCRGEVVRVEKTAEGWLVGGSIEWLED
ncbi:MAG: PilZ domain-containing protein [Thermoanaerobaculia bacterium]|nr:PilZ domain-containing protein [Thermoanaerobaculia bacterium]